MYDVVVSVAIISRLIVSHSLSDIYLFTRICTPDAEVIEQKHLNGDANVMQNEFPLMQREISLMQSRSKNWRSLGITALCEKENILRII